MAALALKIRANKNLRPKIMVFVCSPLIRSDDAAEWAKAKKQAEDLGKFLKKNSVALDIFTFATDESTRECLKSLIKTANSSDNSRYFEGPERCEGELGPWLLTNGGDFLGGGGGGQGGGNMGGNNNA